MKNIRIKGSEKCVFVINKGVVHLEDRCIKCGELIRFKDRKGECCGIEYEVKYE